MTPAPQTRPRPARPSRRTRRTMRRGGSSSGVYAPSCTSFVAPARPFKTPTRPIDTGSAPAVAGAAGAFDYDPRARHHPRLAVHHCPQQAAHVSSRAGTPAPAYRGGQRRAPAPGTGPPSRQAVLWEQEYHQRFCLTGPRAGTRGIPGPPHWQAFWQTAVRGRPRRTSAERLGLSVGRTTTSARSRVLAAPARTGELLQLGRR